MSKNNSINYLPVAGYLLVEPLEETSVKGLNLIAEEFPQLAKVLKVGDSYYDKSKEMIVDSPCKSGQVVIHSSFGFEKFRSEGKEYRIVPFDKVLLIRS
jgi:co-chaperonin GroES (HSP10)